MKMRHPGLVALCLAMAVIGASLIGGVASAKNSGKKHKKGKSHKVVVCHQTGNGSYVRIKISKRALKAHLKKHGDAFPGDAVPGGTLSNDCTVVPPSPQRFTSGPLQFGPNGWGGWSCPPDMRAVGGGTTLTDVAAQGVAQPGATIGGSTYPVFPHHTFAAGETGFVVQNDNDTETGTVFVDCVPK
jgi:hypothetical protein